MARGPDRWLGLAPVDVVPNEAAFNWFVKQLQVGGSLPATAKTVKAKAVKAVLEGMVWQDGGIAAYVIGGECRGLMQFDIAGNAAEIEQLVTGAKVQGGSVPMLEWLVNVRHATSVSLVATQGSVATYQKLGFIGPDNAGYMRLTPANSACWESAGGSMRWVGPPPPPPDDGDVPPPPLN